MNRPSDYSPPPLSLLDPPETTCCSYDGEPLASARLLEGVCRARGLAGGVSQICPGPVVSSYEFVPAVAATRTRLSALADDIRLDLSLPSVRIERAPGGTALHIQISHQAVRLMSMAERLSSDEYRREPGSLPLAFGRNATGEPFLLDLAESPHLPVSGSAGRGMDAFLRAVVTSLLFRADSEVEDSRARLAQVSRAVGIHVIVATTRPTPDVVTNFIDPNFPVRAAFGMPSKAESREVLDALDAVKLLERCDMLHPTRSGQPLRVHPPPKAATTAGDMYRDLNGPRRTRNAFQGDGKCQQRRQRLRPSGRLSVEHDPQYTS